MWVSYAIYGMTKKKKNCSISCSSPQRVWFTSERDPGFGDITILRQSQHTGWHVPIRISDLSNYRRPTVFKSPDTFPFTTKRLLLKTDKQHTNSLHIASYELSEHVAGASKFIHHFEAPPGPHLYLRTSTQAADGEQYVSQESCPNVSFSPIIYSAPANRKSAFWQFATPNTCLLPHPFRLDRLTKLHGAIEKHLAQLYFFP